MSKFWCITAYLRSFCLEGNRNKAPFWYFVANVMQKGAYLILIPIWTRAMTVAEYGIYTVTDSWMEIILVITSLNLFQNTYNVAVKKYDDRVGVSSAFCGVSIFFTALCAASFMTAYRFFSDVFRVDWVILGAIITYLFAAPIDMIWCSMKRFHYETVGLVVLTFIRTVLVVALGLSVLLADSCKVEFALYAKAISELAIGIYAICDIKKRGGHLWRYEYWKFAFKMAIPLIPYYLSLRILQHLDRLMIDRIAGAAAAAKYGLIYKVTSAMMILNSSLNAAFVPWLYSHYSKQNQGEINGTYRRLTLILFGVNLTASLLAPEIVAVFGTSEYKDAIYVMAPVALSAVFIFIYDQCVNVELYYERKSVNSLFAIFISGVNGVLNWIFIGRCGYVAAGYTTFVSYFIFMVLHICYTKRLCVRKDAITVYDKKGILLFTGLCVVSIMAVPFLYQFVLLRYILVVLILLVLYKSIFLRGGRT